MLKKTIKIAAKAITIILALLLILVFLASIWIYTGNRSIPYLNNYLKTQIALLVPENIAVDINDIFINLDKSFKIRFQLSNFKITNLNRGEFNTSDISIYVDPLAIFTNDQRNLLNIKLTNPAMIFNEMENSFTHTLLPIQEINEYLELHKSNLLTFSLSLDNTAFDISRDKKSEIFINEIVIKPVLNNDKMVLTLSADLNIAGQNNILNVTMDTSSNKYLSIKGNLKGLSNHTFEEFGLDLSEFNESKFIADVNFTALVKGTHAIDYIEFDAINHNGIIRAKNYFQNDIKLSTIKLKGYCNDNCKDITVEKLNIKTDDLEIASNFEFNSLLATPILNLNFEIGSIDILNTSNYWPSNMAIDARKWIFQHIKEGKVSNAKGTLQFQYKDLSHNNLVNTKSDVLLNLENVKIENLKYIGQINDIDGSIQLDNGDIKFNVLHGSILNSIVKNGHGSVMNNKTVKLSTDISGPLEDVIHLINDNTKDINEDSKNIAGTATSNISLEFPIDVKELTLQDLTIKGQSHIQNLSYKDTHKNLHIDNGDFDLNLDKFDINIKGNARLNELFEAWVTSRYKILSGDNELKLKTKIPWSQLPKIGIKKPEFIDNYVDLTLEHSRSDGKSRKIMTLDLTNSTINHRSSGIKKKLGEAGVFRVMFEEDTAPNSNNYIIRDYYLNLPNLESKGSALINNDFHIERINSTYNKFNKGNFKFDLTIKGNDSHLNIYGDSFDISNIKPILENSSSHNDVSTSQTNLNKNSSTFIIDSKIKRLFLKNDQVLLNPSIRAEIVDDNIKELKINGNMQGDSTMNLSIKYPIISLTSNDAGKVAKAFDITNKIEGGELNLYGKLSNLNFDGTLDIKNYRMRKAPLMAKIISVVSITTTSLEGLSNVFTNRGIKFDHLKCPLNLGDGVLNFKSCYAKGPTLTFTAEGSINFNHDKVNIKGSVIPENILNMAIRNIPIIGSAFTQKKDHAFIGATYTVNGSIDDPHASSNPLSILAPGFLKEIF